MIDLYTWSTPNGRKISICLEELGLPYQVIPVDIGNDQQFDPDFLRISPNNKIPAIVDHETGFSLMESGAILLYLSEKTGRLAPHEPHLRYQMLEWLMWQMGGLGPMLGQAHHFLKNNPGKSAYSEQRYQRESERLYGVLDRRLADREFIVGEYSLADIACWPWISRFEWHQVEINEFPNVRRWYIDIAGRPAVQAGYDVPARGLSIPFPPELPVRA